MVGHYTHGHVLLRVGSVGRAGHGGDGLDEGLEDVGVIVGRLALQGHAETFEAHAGVDNLGGKFLQAAVGLAVELHEDEVPDLDDLRVVVVHHVPSGHLGFLFLAAEVDVDFGAGSAGTRVAHLPEVIVLVAVNDMVFREELFPIGGRLVIAAQTLLGTTLENGSIEIGRIYLQDVHQVLPSPRDSLFLEVVAEGPVAQHLEHGVVVRIVPHFFQVVVLTADAQALLRIGHPLPFGRMVSQDNILELVHARVGEHQRGVILNHHRSGGDDMVSLALKETLKRVSDFICCQHTLV